MTYAIFIWHNVFLAITMSMIDVNLVFPSLITALGGSKITFTLVAGAIVPIHAPSPYGGGSGWGGSRLANGSWALRIRGRRRRGPGCSRRGAACSWSPGILRRSSRGFSKNVSVATAKNSAGLRAA